MNHPGLRPVRFSESVPDPPSRLLEPAEAACLALLPQSDEVWPYPYAGQNSSCGLGDGYPAWRHFRPGGHTGHCDENSKSRAATRSFVVAISIQDHAEHIGVLGDLALAGLELAIGRRISPDHDQCTVCVLEERS